MSCSRTQVSRPGFEPTLCWTETPELEFGALIRSATTPQYKKTDGSISINYPILIWGLIILTNSWETEMRSTLLHVWEEFFLLLSCVQNFPAEGLGSVAFLEACDVTGYIVLSTAKWCKIENSSSHSCIVSKNLCLYLLKWLLCSLFVQVSTLVGCYLHQWLVCWFSCMDWLPWEPMSLRK